MEETLGKRIVANRKQLGLTQDALAERLGVTAQAVSKWENDQSCPDITMLPKLAEVFSVSTDTLLGIERKEIRAAEIVAQQEEAAPKGLRMKSDNGTWEFKWDAGRKSSIGIALWILLAGGLLLAANLMQRDAGFWGILWPSGLLVFGLFGLFPRFSCFRLGCGLLGGYFLLEIFVHLELSRELLLPIFLLLFGLSLLFDALRKPNKESAHINHNGNAIAGTAKNYCNYDGETFDCAASFGENQHLICLPRLSGGKADVSFGELRIDLSGCEEIADGCRLEANCSFGELEILVPRKYRVEAASSTAFAAMEVKGNPDPHAAVTIQMDCNASFGDISIRYI